MKRPFIVALFAIAMVVAAALIPQQHTGDAPPNPPSAAGVAASPPSSLASPSARPKATAPSTDGSSIRAPSPPPSPAPSAAVQRATPLPPIALPYEVNDDANVNDLGRGARFSLDVSAANFHFTPTFIQAVPGARVTVSITNTGTLTHTFTVDALGIDVVLAKGKSGTATVTVPASGYVTFYCRFHWGGGMRGAIYAS